MTSRSDLGGRIGGVHAELRTAAAAGRSFDDRQVVGQVSDAGDNPQGGGKAPLEENEAAPDRSETLLEAPQERKRKRGRRGHRRKAVFLGCGHWYRPPRPRDVVPPPLQGDAGEVAPMQYLAAVQRGARKPTPPVDEIAGLQRKILKLEREAAARETELNTARRVAAERHRVLTEERDRARSERGVPFEELYRVQKDAKVEAQEDAAEEKEDLKRELRVAKIDEDELKELRWRSVSAALQRRGSAVGYSARLVALWKQAMVDIGRLRKCGYEVSEELDALRRWVSMLHSSVLEVEGQSEELMIEILKRRELSWLFTTHSWRSEAMVAEDIRKAHSWRTEDRRVGSRH